MLLLFDIDGTLLLSGGAGSRALNRVFENEYGVRGAMDCINCAGLTDPFIVSTVFETHLGRTPTSEEFDYVFSTYIPLLREELARSDNFRLMPNVIEVLDELERQPRYTLGLATGNIRLAAQAKLERGQLWSRFKTGGFACDAAERAQLVERGIQRAFVDSGRLFRREEILVIGDTVRDVAAAHACGVRCVAVVTGPSSDAQELSAAGADAVIPDLSHLFAHLSI